MTPHSFIRFKDFIMTTATLKDKLVGITLTSCLALTACGPLGDGFNQNRNYPPRDPYDPYYRNEDYRYRDRYEQDRLYRERRELDRERERLDRERREMDRRYDHRDEPRHQRPTRSNDVVEHCPSGWKPGRCSDRDRKKGCKDKRMPLGLGCRTN